MQQIADAVQVEVGVHELMHAGRQERQVVCRVGIAVHKFAHHVAVLDGSGQKRRHHAAEHHGYLQQGEQHGQKAPAQVRPAHVPLHERLGHVGYEAAHAEGQQGFAQIVYKPDDRCGHRKREHYAGHAVECERTVGLGGHGKVFCK